ncbi:MAG TPA: O-antigen ligase family protein [Bacteroidia bacterium]|nr:O-antigen ligase family protein [Bacteroidia bacterium]
MKKLSINKILPAFIFSFLVFAVMPFVYSLRLLDPELSFRFIFISLLVFFFFLYFFLKRSAVHLPPVNQKLTLIFISYILLNSITLLFATDKNESFYEWIRLLIFLFFYVCLLIILQKNDEALPVIIKNINVCILVFSAIALLQLYPFVINYFETGKPFTLSLSIASSLGNKNFYSEVLLMSLPLVLYGIYIFKKTWKGISVFNAVLILVTIFFLQTLSVWIGMLTGVLLFAFFYRNTLFQNKKIRTSVIITSVFIIVLAGAIIFLKPVFFKSIISKYNVALRYITDPRALETFSLENNNSTYERIILWRNSFRMIKEHPFFGVGLGEWKIYFPKYGMGQAPYMNTGMIRFEKPHNDFLLIWCESGLPGLASYVSLFIVSFIYCRKIIKGKQMEKDKLLMRLVSAGLAAFLVISFLGYPNQRPFTMIFLMLLFAVVQSEYLKLFPAKKNLNVKKFYAIFFISGILISGYGVNIGIKRLKSEMHLSNALRAQKYKNWGIMFREAEKAKSDFFRMDYTSTPINWYMGFASFYAGNREQAFINFKEAEKMNPYHFNLLNDIGTCYDLQGNSEMAKLYYHRAIGISPLFPDANVNLSVIYYNAGNIDSAYAYISKNNLGTNPNYVKDLKVILRAKAQQIIQQVSDSATKANLSEKIKDENWLLSLHKDAQKTNNKLENLLTGIKP